MRIQTMTRRCEATLFFGKQPLMNSRRRKKIAAANELLIDAFCALNSAQAAKNCKVFLCHRCRPRPLGHHHKIAVAGQHGRNSHGHQRCRRRREGRRHRCRVRAHAIIVGVDASAQFFWCCVSVHAVAARSRRRCSAACRNTSSATRTPMFWWREATPSTRRRRAPRCATSFRSLRRPRSRRSCSSTRCI